MMKRASSWALLSFLVALLVLPHEAPAGWQIQRPFLPDLLAVWGSSSKDVFAVGAGGDILHFDGNNWKPMASNTSSNLWNAWGISSTDVFAIGDNGTIVHFDGRESTAMAGGVKAQLFGTWGSSAKDVFVVGTKGTILHYSSEN